MTAQDVRASHRREHSRRRRPREGPLALGVQVLRSYDNLVALHAVHLFFVSPSRFRCQNIGGILSTSLSAVLAILRLWLWLVLLLLFFDIGYVDGSLGDGIRVTVAPCSALRANRGHGRNRRRRLGGMHEHRELIVDLLPRHLLCPSLHHPRLRPTPTTGHRARTQANAAGVGRSEQCITCLGALKPSVTLAFETEKGLAAGTERPTNQQTMASATYLLAPGFLSLFASLRLMMVVIFSLSAHICIRATPSPPSLPTISSHFSHVGVIYALDPNGELQKVTLPLGQRLSPISPTRCY